MQTPWSDMHSISLFGLLQALVFKGSLHGFCLAWLPQLFDHTDYCIWQHACNTVHCMAFACSFVAKLVSRLAEQLADMDVSSTAMPSCDSAGITVIVQVLLYACWIQR